MTDWPPHFPYTFPFPLGRFPVSGKITIGGVWVHIRTDSLWIQANIGERSTAGFIVLDTGGIQTYRRGNPVIIKNGDEDVIFTGFVASSTETRMAPGGGLFHTIKCMDAHYLADKRVCAESYTDKTCGFIVDDILTNYLAAEGVLDGDIQLGPVLSSLMANYVPISDVFDRLAELAGFIWWIDIDYKLYFVARATFFAPQGLDKENTIKGKTKLTHGDNRYRNTQYVRGGTGETSSQTEEQEGDATAISFTLGYPVAKVPSVWTNIAAAGWVAKTVGIKAIDSGKDWYWSKGDGIITQDSGGVVLAGGDFIRVTYVGQYDIIALVEDEDEVSDQLAIEGMGTGQVDSVTDRPSIITADEGIETAIALITKFAADAQTYNCVSIDSGFAPGQIVSVTDADHNLAAEDMLIDSVTTKRKDKQWLFHIRAITGPAHGSWGKFFASLIPSELDIDVEIGSGTLIILKQTSDDWEWETKVDPVEVYACDLPGVALWPELTRYPC